ncbi:MAG: hypothetical protein KDA99_01575 [Planctomycetales bacterium]|nr:hypothetical protein [Planctomycetales bacterium]
MGQVTEVVNAVSGLIRSLVYAAAVCGVGYGGGWLYTHYWSHGVSTAQLQQARQEIAELQHQLQLKDMHIDQLDTALHLLKVDQRVAELRVLRQEFVPGLDRVISEISFVEMNDQGEPIDVPRKFTIEGDTVYLDYWVVKFEDRYIEQSAVNRATSICLFRKVFGEYQRPAEGFDLDAVNMRPAAYARGKEISDFERRIWGDFWNIAHSPEKATELGIRAAHGQASYTKLRPGVTYRLSLRASDGMTIQPIGNGEPPVVGTLHHHLL